MYLQNDLVAAVMGTADLSHFNDWVAGMVRQTHNHYV
jgi:hypothetical protein